MKNRYRLYRRQKGVFYLFDNLTAKRESLKTDNEATATRILSARNEACHHPSINLQIARAFLIETDSGISKRTWQIVMDEMANCKKGTTRERWERAMREKSFDLIRNLVILETRAEHLFKVLTKGTVSTNIFLRRLHNFALDMNWLPARIIPGRQWPKIEFADKRAITFEEHRKILANERNPEWKAYYELLWHLGGSQSDVASLQAEDIDWAGSTVGYRRLKNKTPVLVHFGDTVAAILRALPQQGALFEMLGSWPESDRAKAFIRRCRHAGVSGVTLHSYRYAWAERAKTAGYPERFAMENLGHKSKAVHRAYAKKAQMKLPSLEDYEKRFVPVEFKEGKIV